MLFITRYDGFLYQGHIARQQLLVKAISDRKPYRTLREFYPFYLSEHTNQVSRRLHFVGTTTALILLVNALIKQLWWLILIAFVQGYAFAWVGHFFYEYNRPATFTYPLLSFFSDWYLWWEVFTSKIRF